MSVEVCSPLTNLAAQRPFRRKIGQQTEEIAMQCANQDLNPLRQPNLLPFSASWRCYPGNLGLGPFFPLLIHSYGPARAHFFC